MNESALQRFTSKFQVEEGTQCWIWTASLSTSGYGQLWIESATRYAHRLAYEHFIGPIPNGLQIDHLCRNRECVNPAHLDAVTARENNLRCDCFSGVNARKTHCKHGHPFDAKNTRLKPNGRRDCRICADRNWRTWRAKHGRGPLR